ncbi:hypothetical protein MODO_1126 [Myroides odoratimimus]|uniref:hypothetical protein n=1 Tax=Myroides odoratimimus TaxID=76832 RepID=UPI000726192E|nr:hypothetical protein [Myroides odoratimimus]GAQ13471.1 hypothetical protein MODO_1126 [Myroides odoratimimus]STZ48039.1 Uncharacterised protein [Myroides odoratimimus]
MNANQIPLESHLWTREGILCPYRIIKEMFSVYRLEDYKNSLNEYSYYVLEIKKRYEGTAGDMVYRFFILHSVFRACHTIFKNPKEFEKRNLTIKKTDNIDDFYLGSLTLEEYLNPYMTFMNIFTMVTVEDLDYLSADYVQDALKEKQIFEVHYQIPPIYLYKLLDACWLIYKRLQ